MRRSSYALISRVALWTRSEVGVHATRRATGFGGKVVGSWLACAALIAGVTAATAAHGSDHRVDLEVISVDGATTARRLRRDQTGGGGGVGTPLENGSFAAGLDAWSATETGGAAVPGGVSVADESAVLSEGDSFLVTLSQEFVLAPAPSLLTLGPLSKLACHLGSFPAAAPPARWREFLYSDSQTFRQRFRCVQQEGLASFNGFPPIPTSIKTPLDLMNPATKFALGIFCASNGAEAGAAKAQGKAAGGGTGGSWTGTSWTKY